MHDIDPLRPANLKSIQDRLWYVNSGDALLGPFNTKELISQIIEEKIKLDQYLWAQEYEDWFKISEEKSLLSFIEQEKKIQTSNQFLAANKRIESAIDLQNRYKEDFWNQIENGSLLNRENEEIHHKDFVDYYKEKQNMLFPKTETKTPIQTVQINQPKINSETILNYLVYFCIILAGFCAVYFKFYYKNPLNVPELSDEQNLELRTIIKESLNPIRPLFAVFALNVENDPSFVIATNVPDASVVQLKIEGQAESLIGAFTALYQINLKVHQGIVKSPSLLSDELSSVPKGEYKISVRCIDCKTKEISLENNLYEKKLFLGGIKDDTYDLQLVKYHSDLRQKSRTELQMFKQLLSSINKQYIALENEYKINIEFYRSEALWTHAYEQWSATQAQLRMELERLLGLSAKNEIYYFEFLKQIKQTYLLLDKIERRKNLNSKSFKKDKLSEEIEFKSLIGSLLNKVAELETLPLMANGMPRKFSN